ncbi:MAG: hypothetical protein ACE141_19405 [Bryobacteraceae bacterium]
MSGSMVNWQRTNGATADELRSRIDAELTRLAKQKARDPVFRQQFEGDEHRIFRAALDAVYRENPELLRAQEQLRMAAKARIFGIKPNGEVVEAQPAPTREEVETLLLEKLAAKQKENPGMPYKEVLKVVASEEPALVRQLFRI